MVQFKNVTKIYDKRIVAVNEVSFRLIDGEFVFLIGPSGSGKSTLIKMLVRDETPTVGNVYFNDRDITRVNRSKVYKIRREIGVIFQDFKLIQDKTAYENIAFAMEVAGKKAHEIKETVPYVLDIVGLSQRMKAFPRQLSGGEQQRVAIARALSNNPKLLIADEPTGNLDPGSAWDIIQILTKINQWGTTVIMSTHGTDIVNTLGKRVIQMEKGRVIRDDDKGKYEMAKEFESNMAQSVDETKEKKSGPIKISIKKGNKANEQVEAKQEQELDENESNEVVGLDNAQKTRLLLNPFKRKNKKIQIEKDNSNADQSRNSHAHLHFDLNETVSESEDNQKSEPAKETQIQKTNEESSVQARTDKKDNAMKFASIVAQAKAEKESQDTPLKELELPSKIYKILKKSGFQTVEQVIEAGPEGLESIVDLTPENIIDIAKKITDFTDE